MHPTSSTDLTAPAPESLSARVRVLVVYATVSGHTEQMAATIADGARSVPGTGVSLLPVEQAGEEDVRATDALIVGSPNHHQGADPRVREFQQSVLLRLWEAGSLVGKVGAVFGTGGGFGAAGAGAELMLLGLLAPMAWSGMIIVPLPTSTPGFPAGGLAWGPWARTAADDRTNAGGVNDQVLLAAAAHGANVARVAAALVPAGAGLFAGAGPRDRQGDAETQHVQPGGTRTNDSPGPGGGGRQDRP